MIDMFTNYQELSEYYIPNNLSENISKPCSYTKLDPCQLSKPYELYNAKGELEGYYWHYGESIIFDFSIEGEITELEANGYVSLEDYLQDKRCSFKLYNFRGEEVYSRTIHAATELQFTIDLETSEKLVKGTYTCSLTVFNNQVIHNIFDRDDCRLLVK